MERRGAPPPGIALLRLLRRRDFSFAAYRTLVLLVTFIAYACYHASRKPPSIVKSVLDPESAAATSGSQGTILTTSFLNPIFIPAAAPPSPRASLSSSDGPSKQEQGWAPFNGADGKARLGEIDVAFLACYAFGMFFAGHLGDRLDLRAFLALGMVGSGAFVCLFGLGYWWNIHSIGFYLGVQMAAGLFQATGWPSVVAIVGNWCGKSKRGLVMGVWNAHTSVGNILGSLLAAAVVSAGWGYSFILPGLLIIAAGILVYLFLVVHPADVGLEEQDEQQQQEEQLPTSSSSSLFPAVDDEGQAAVPVNRDEGAVPAAAAGYDQEAALSRRPMSPQRRHKPVRFMEAWLIPGVAPFAFCLFFAKLVAYTFLYWLPFYIRHTRIAGQALSEKTAGNLSTLFDIGGVVGGILAGHISDRLNARAITAASFMYLAIPALFLYHEFGDVSMGFNAGLMMLTGMLVNGPYALITTAVSADLGTHESLKGDARALATVTAIIDGCGSIGAAVGPLLTGFISQTGWDNVFNMLMVSALVAGLLLSRLVANEALEKFRGFRRKRSSGDVSEPLLK